MQSAPKGRSTHCCCLVTGWPAVANTAAPAPATASPTHTSLRLPFTFGVFDEPFGAAHSNTATNRTRTAEAAEIDMLRLWAGDIWKFQGPGPVVRPHSSESQFSRMPFIDHHLHQFNFRLPRNRPDRAAMAWRCVIIRPKAQT